LDLDQAVGEEGVEEEDMVVEDVVVMEEDIGDVAMARVVILIIVGTGLIGIITTIAGPRGITQM
jgi:hypothetical protein